MDDIMNDDSIIPSSEDYIEAMNDIILTTNENYNMLMERIYIRELAIFEATGELCVYNEASVDDFILGIKKFLLKVWRAIAGMFKSFMQMIDKYTLNDKRFISKYRDKLLKHQGDSNFSFTGHIFTINDQELGNAIHELELNPLDHTVANTTTTTTTQTNTNTTTNTTQTNTNNQQQNTQQQNNGVNPAQADSNTNFNNNFGSGNIKDITTLRANLETDLEGVRMRVVKHFSHRTKKDGTRLDDKDFYNELCACLRNGHEIDDKEELNLVQVDVPNMIAEMDGYRNTRRTLNNSMREGKRVIDASMKEAASKQKEVMNQTVESQKIENHNKGKTKEQVKQDKLREVSYYITWKNRTANMLTTVEGSIIRALKDRSKQYKACCIELINYKPDENKGTSGTSTS